MKKTFRLIGLAIVAVIAAFAMTACGIDDDDDDDDDSYNRNLIGTWKFRSNSEYYKIIDIRRDNTYTFTSYSEGEVDETWSGTWRADDDDILFILKDGYTTEREKYEYVIQNRDVIIFYDEYGDSMRGVRVGSQSDVDDDNDNSDDNQVVPGPGAVDFLAPLEEADFIGSWSASGLDDGEVGIITFIEGGKLEAYDRDSDGEVEFDQGEWRLVDSNTLLVRYWNTSMKAWDEWEAAYVAMNTAKTRLYLAETLADMQRGDYGVMVKK